jgi:hypothetical protein
VNKFIIHKNNNYQIVLWVLLAVAVIILLQLAPILSNPEFLPADDYVQFWSAGRLNIQGENPFSQIKIQQILIELGGQVLAPKTISIMLNPPWAITLFMPYGLLHYPISRLAWLISSTILILISSLMFWKIYSGKPKQRWLLFISVFIFAPTISVLEKGQTTPILLIGLTGFLYFIAINQNDWLAGICLALASTKPQIIFLFWVALFLWIIHQRRWLMLLSASITILALSLIALIFNHQIIQQYLSMLRTYPISDWANPTIGAYLRYFIFGTGNLWIQFLPALLGGIWIVYYWLTHYHSWNWIDEFPMIILLSIITSPYSWTYDYVILLPVIVQGIILVARYWKRWWTLFLAIMYLSITVLDLYLHQRLNDFWFIWLAPSMLILYLIIRWQYPPKKEIIFTQVL